MLWKLLGDAVLALHALWVLAVVLGPLWCWKRPRWRAAHLGMAAATVLFDLTLGACPLTWLENLLALRAGAAAYEESFLSHFAGKLVYWDIDPSRLSAATGAWLLLWLGVYARLWRRERTR